MGSTQVVYYELFNKQLSNYQSFFLSQPVSLERHHVSCLLMLGKAMLLGLQNLQEVLEGFQNV